MVMPLDAVTVVHSAFRRDLTEIDEEVKWTPSSGQR